MDQGIVLITGGSGNIGRAVSARLRGRYQVVSLDVTKEKNPASGIHYLEMDVSSPKSVHDALTSIRSRFGGRVASVLHLAAYYSFSGKPSPKYDQITVEGTRALLRELNALGLEVEQFVFSSTMLVHAPLPPPLEIRETSPVAPSWEYPESKVKAEEAIRLEHESIPVINARIAGVYDDRCHSIPLSNHIKRIHERQLTSIFFPGDKTHGQAFVHMEDLVEAFALMIEKRTSLPRDLTLLIGEPEALSFEELQETIGCLIHGKEWATIRIPSHLAKIGAWFQTRLPYLPEPFIKPWMIDFADDHYDLDVSRARELLGWAPTHTLRETLPKMIQALQQDPQKWYRENKLSPPNRLAESFRERALSIAGALAVAGITVLALGIFGAARRSRVARASTQPDPRAVA